MSLTAEIPKTQLSPEDWEYFGGVLDEAIKPYAWQKGETRRDLKVRAEV